MISIYSFWSDIIGYVRISHSDQSVSCPRSSERARCCVLSLYEAQGLDLRLLRCEYTYTYSKGKVCRQLSLLFVPRPCATGKQSRYPQHVRLSTAAGRNPPLCLGMWSGVSTYLEYLTGCQARERWITRFKFFYIQSITSHHISFPTAMTNNFVAIPCWARVGCQKI